MTYHVRRAWPSSKGIYDYVFIQVSSRRSWLSLSLFSLLISGTRCARRAPSAFGPRRMADAARRPLPRPLRLVFSAYGAAEYQEVEYPLGASARAVPAWGEQALPDGGGFFSAAVRYLDVPELRIAFF